MNNCRLDLLTGRILTGALVLGLCSTGIVHAQNTRSAGATAAAAPDLEEIVVTGTSIKGLNAETSLPVQVL